MPWNFKCAHNSYYWNEKWCSRNKSKRSPRGRKMRKLAVTWPVVWFGLHQRASGGERASAAAPPPCHRTEHTGNQLIAISQCCAVVETELRRGKLPGLSTLDNCFGLSFETRKLCLLLFSLFVQVWGWQIFIFISQLNLREIESDFDLILSLHPTKNQFKIEIKMSTSTIWSFMIYAARRTIIISWFLHFPMQPKLKEYYEDNLGFIYFKFLWQCPIKKPMIQNHIWRLSFCH